MQESIARRNINGALSAALIVSCAGHGNTRCKPLALQTVFVGKQRKNYGVSRSLPSAKIGSGTGQGDLGNHNRDIHGHRSRRLSSSIRIKKGPTATTRTEDFGESQAGTLQLGWAIHSRNHLHEERQSSRRLRSQQESLGAEQHRAGSILGSGRVWPRTDRLLQPIP
jgi:hypothetical protein